MNFGRSFTLEGSTMSIKARAIRTITLASVALFAATGAIFA